MTWLTDTHTLPMWSLSIFQLNIAGIFNPQLSTLINSLYCKFVSDDVPCACSDFCFFLFAFHFLDFPQNWKLLFEPFWRVLCEFNCFKKVQKLYHSLIHLILVAFEVSVTIGTAEQINQVYFGFVTAHLFWKKRFYFHILNSNTYSNWSSLKFSLEIKTFDILFWWIFCGNVNFKVPENASENVGGKPENTVATVQLYAYWILYGQWTFLVCVCT